MLSQSNTTQVFPAQSSERIELRRQPTKKQTKRSKRQRAKQFLRKKARKLRLGLQKPTPQPMARETRYTLPKRDILLPRMAPLFSENILAMFAGKLTLPCSPVSPQESSQKHNQVPFHHFIMSLVDIKACISLTGLGTITKLIGPAMPLVIPRKRSQKQFQMDTITEAEEPEKEFVDVPVLSSADSDTLEPEVVEEEQWPEEVPFSEKKPPLTRDMRGLQNALLYVSRHDLMIEKKETQKVRFKKLDEEVVFDKDQPPTAVRRRFRFKKSKKPLKSCLKPAKKVEFPEFADPIEPLQCINRWVLAPGELDRCLLMLIWKANISQEARKNPDYITKVAEAAFEFDAVFRKFAANVNIPCRARFVALGAKLCHIRRSLAECIHGAYGVAAEIQLRSFASADALKRLHDRCDNLERHLLHYQKHLRPQLELFAKEAAFCKKTKNTVLLWYRWFLQNHPAPYTDTSHLYEQSTFLLTDSDPAIVKRAFTKHTSDLVHAHQFLSDFLLQLDSQV